MMSETERVEIEMEMEVEMARRPNREEALGANGKRNQSASA